MATSEQILEHVRAHGGSQAFAVMMELTNGADDMSIFSLIDRLVKTGRLVRVPTSDLKSEDALFTPEEYARAVEGCVWRWRSTRGR